MITSTGRGAPVVGAAAPSAWPSTPPRSKAMTSPVPPETARPCWTISAWNCPWETESPFTQWPSNTGSCDGSSAWTISTSR